MTRCTCLGASHGPACPLLDAFDYEAEERECRRIEAALRDVEVLSDRDVNPENVMRLLRDATGHSTGTCPGHERGDA